MLADNWYATRREQVAGLEAAGARVETADVRAREDVRRLLELGPSRVFLLAAQASRPHRGRGARLHGGDERRRDAARRGGGRAGRRASGPLRQLAPGVRAGVVAPGRGRAGDPVRAADRSRAPDEGLRRARPRHARAAGRLRPRAPAARDRLRPEPRRARRARVGHGRGLVSVAWPRPASRSPWTTPPRSSASSTSRTRRASCSRPSRPASTRRTSPPRRVTVGDDRGPRRGTGAAGRRSRALREPVRVPALRRGVPRAMRILVTGASGFLGSRVAALLAESGPRRRPSRAAGRARAGRGRRRRGSSASTRAIPPRATSSPGATPSSTSRASRTRRRPTPIPRARCARTPGRRSTSSRAAPSTARRSSTRRRPRRARPAPGRLRGLEAARRGVLPPPPGALDRSSGSRRCSARARSPARARPARSRASRPPRSRASRSSSRAIPGAARDFVYVDDLVPVFERIAAEGAFWSETLTLARGETTPLLRAAELVAAAAGTEIADRDAGRRARAGRERRRTGRTRRRRI